MDRLLQMVRADQPRATQGPGEPLLVDRIAAPAGAPFDGLLIVVEKGQLLALDYCGHEARLLRLLARRRRDISFIPSPDPCGLASRLRRYLAGELHAIDGIALDAGGTAFQRAAWLALTQIPPGRTASYAEQARRVGRPRAVRALGAANGQNPIAIVLPCHRVIGSDGSLTGYAGGVETKAWLLQHEARWVRPSHQASP